MRCKCLGQFLSILRVARLYVIICNRFNKAALLLTHPLVKAATIGQTLMVVCIWRAISLSSAPISFQSFLNNLMTHKCHVKPSSCLVHSFSRIKIIIGYIKPICNSSLFHTSYIPFGCKYTTYFLLFQEKPQKTYATPHSSIRRVTTSRHSPTA